MAEPTFKPTAKINGYFQVQANYDQSDTEVDDFHIRRARIGFIGSVTENVTYKINVGAVEQPDSQPHLVNAFVDLHHIPNTIVRVGQGLLPFGLEASESVPVNPDIDRAVTIKRLNPFFMFRDRGVQVRTQLNNMYYAVAVVNGSGANSRDDSGAKDIVAQLRATLMPGLKLGLSGHTGSVVESTKTLQRSRLGVDAEWKRNATTVRAEYITYTTETVSDGDVTATGWYLLGLQKLPRSWEGFVRVEQYKANVHESDTLLTIATLGAHYVLSGKSRLSASYAIQDDEADAGLKNKLTTQLQIAF
jgi:phosphate-selective porin